MDKLFGFTLLMMFLSVIKSVVKVSTRFFGSFKLASFFVMWLYEKNNHTGFQSDVSVEISFMQKIKLCEICKEKKKKHYNWQRFGLV